MDTQLVELKLSFKDLIKNLIIRINPICNNLEKGLDEERLIFWLQDLSILTESVLVLDKMQVIDYDIDLFNEKVTLLLDKVEEKDFLFVSDIMQFELEPLLSYWDECITND